MELRNQTMDNYFILMVFYEKSGVKAILFLCFMTIYTLTLIGNLLLILLWRIDRRLLTPMYFFLVNLSFIDICFTTTIAPKMLTIYITRDKSISFLGCAIQMLFSLALGSAEILLIAVMAYDRHMAICQPLRYHAFMNRRICFLLAAMCWVCGFVDSLIETVFTFLRPFCKSRDLGHFFCEIQPLLRVTRADTRSHEMWEFAANLTVDLCAFLLILYSYIHIISTILKIQSSKGRSKLFSTCSSHLMMVIIFYGTLMSVYLTPLSSYTPKKDRVISLFYTMVTPMFNPLIYSIRNKEVKDAMRKAIGITICTLEMR